MMSFDLQTVVYVRLYVPRACVTTMTLKGALGEFLEPGSTEDFIRAEHGNYVGPTELRFSLVENPSWPNDMLWALEMAEGGSLSLLYSSDIDGELLDKLLTTHSSLPSTMFIQDS